MRPWVTVVLEVTSNSWKRACVLASSLFEVVERHVDRGGLAKTDEKGENLAALEVDKYNGQFFLVLPDGECAHRKKAIALRKARARANAVALGYVGRPPLRFFWGEWYPHRPPSAWA